MKNNPITYAVLAGSGMGGTEKAATVWAAGMAQLGHRVDFLCARGPRSDWAESHGVRYLPDAAASARALAGYLSTCLPDVVHQHVSGYRKESILYEIWDSLPVRPRLIETNVFGRLEDPVGDRIVDSRMFVSLASGVQAFRRARLKWTPDLLARHNVVLYPVPVERQAPGDPGTRSHRRHELGVGESDILAVRIGQKGDVKWRTWESAAVRLARKNGAVPLRLLLMEPGPRTQSLLEKRGLMDGVIIHPATPDQTVLRSIYCAADFMIHASNHGESFGYTVAEGMAAGLPVVVLSTPFGDNAQVELVRHGVDGFVCASVRDLSAAAACLAMHPAKRIRMGVSARERISEYADARGETLLLEAIAMQVLGRASDRQLALLRRRHAEWKAFADRFDDLQYQSFTGGIAGVAHRAHLRMVTLARNLRTKAGRLARKLRQSGRG